MTASAKTIAQDVIDGGQPPVPSLFSTRPVSVVVLVAVAAVHVVAGVVPEEAPLEGFNRVGWVPDEADGVTNEFPWIGDKIVIWDKNTNQVIWEWNVPRCSEKFWVAVWDRSL